MRDKDRNWPAWYSSPDGKQTQIFQGADEVPAGWTTGAEKKALKLAPSAPKPPPASPSPTTAGNAPEIDAHGHPWSADLHSATKSKTSAGLWRMGVGKSRPAPLPGFPKLDL